MKYLALTLCVLGLTACMGAGKTTTQSTKGLSNCGHLGGMAADYMHGNNLRCGPQTQRPY